MSIRKKLNFSLLSIFSLLLISVVVTLLQLLTIEDKFDYALDNRVQQQILSDEIQIELGMQGLYLRSMILNNTEQTKEALILHQDLLDEAILKLDKLASSETMKTYLSEINKHNDAFNDAADEVLTNLNSGNKDRALQVVNNEAHLANEGILAVALEINEYQKDQLKIITAETKEIVKNTIRIGLAILVVSILLTIGISLFIKRSITNRLKHLVVTTEIISNGDLTASDINNQVKDEIGDVARSFNKMKANLKDLIISLHENANHLSSVSEELSASTEEVTAASTDVAKRVEMTSEGAHIASISAKDSATAMDETAAGVQRIAEATQVLQSNATNTLEFASKGEEVLKTAKGQMNQIYNSSSETNQLIKKLSVKSIEIENITKVITGISEQTNLLALNAAIEAARAGEHGKGFAVVADEVRKLAEESKYSANQIVALITEIQKDTRNVEESVLIGLHNTEEGVKVINEANISFQSIASSIEQVSYQIEDISATSEEIAASAEEVAASVAEIVNQTIEASSQTTMISAAVEEQTATMQEINSVAQDLTQKAVELEELIYQFKI
ncbi:methyl-accepting chemotaxis protein [Psychrobacillus sp. MER TA 171]|uniref:methyl-accepting chemotaxis protein n=1 Tax=Psychrobacillus sp. MER TA 171 TaxID=2939577 RepID=UPI00203F2E3D|nr:methyl-accepting chemotaxis protein [Psychrobacillus sp. MER TA 171]